MTETPDVVGTIRAYRRWVVGKDGGLNSMTGMHPLTWMNATAHAHCGHSGEIPTLKCTCGLYACRSPFSSQLPWDMRGFACGVVECWGGLIPHEKNTVIRAEHAKIMALCMPRQRWKNITVEKVQARYPQVKIYRSRAKMLRDFPPEVPKRKPAEFVSMMFLLTAVFLYSTGALMQLVHGIVDVMDWGGLSGAGAFLARAWRTGLIFPWRRRI